MRGAVHTYRLGAGTAGIDQGGDRVGVVVVADGQSLVGERGGVVGDEVLEVVGDLLCLCLGHAGTAADGVGIAAAEDRLGQGAGEGEERRSRENGAEGAHLELRERGVRKKNN